MKRAKIIACITALIVVLSATGVFAGENFKIEETYPENGQKNTTVENMSVKLRFNHDVDKKANRKANDKCFKIVDKNGKKMPVKVLYDTKNSKRVLVLVDMTKGKVKIKDNQKYTLQISKNLVDNEGNKLGENQEITFQTLNQAWNTKVYMGLMFLMFGGMIFFTTRQSKKATEEKEVEIRKETFNPYKESKRTGKPLETVIEEHQKEMEKLSKREKRLQKKAAKDEALERKIEERLLEEYRKEHKDYHYWRLKRPRPISEGGATYKTGRKALAEARKAEEERLAKRRAANKKRKKK